MSCRDSRFLLVKDKLEMMVKVGRLEMMVKVGRLEQHSAIGWPVLVRDNDAAKMSRVNCEWCEEKSC